jgi:hypothetical protein
MSKEFKSKVIDHYSLILDAEDGTQPVVWKMCFDFGALARFEELTGIDPKKIASWPIPSSKFPELVWASLRRFNPEVTLAEVQDKLNPDAFHALYDEIFLMMFPVIRDEIKRQEQAKETGATADPNAATATTKQ